jgi:hypothetical protein
VKDEQGFRQVMSYVDKLISSLSTQDGNLLPSSAACEQSRGRVEAALTGRGSRILHSYCEEQRDWRGNVEGFRYKIHHVKPEEN